MVSVAFDVLTGGTVAYISQLIFLVLRYVVTAVECIFISFFLNVCMCNVFVCADVCRVIVVIGFNLYILSSCCMLCSKRVD